MLNSSLKSLTIGLLSFAFILLAHSTVFSATLPICTEFEDVQPGNTFYPFVHVLSCRSIVNGYPCGQATGETCNASQDPYYRPGNRLSRAQGSQMISNAADFQEDAGAQMFQDVPPGSTFYNFVNRLARRQILAGYPCGQATGEDCVAPANLPYFRPNTDMTRAQLAKITAVAAGYTEAVSGQTFEDIAPGSTFYDYVERLSKRGVINGYPCGSENGACVPPANRPYFKPNDPVTRQQAAQFVTLAFFKLEVTPNPTANPTGTPGACEKKSLGDADCNGVINNVDYLYYVTKVNGGSIPANVSPDFNKDGEIGTKDRDIIVHTLSGSGTN